jgi:hypothetical protein
MEDDGTRGRKRRKRVYAYSEYIGVLQEGTSA